MNEKTWYQLLAERRKDYCISQEKLAVEAGISRKTLGYIESGQRTTSNEIRIKLDEALERLNPNATLEIIIDYVRIRFPTQDMKHVVESILRMKLKYFAHEDFGFYSYEEHYRWGDIYLLSSTDERKGILLELKGRGCHQFENILITQDRSWFDFFYIASLTSCKFKRIDLAINDRFGMISIPELARKCEDEECISVFRSFRYYRSGELVKKDEKSCMGNTLYIGSLKSEIYMCIYEKDYEQYIKEGIPIEEADVRNRFEIRLKNIRADIAVNDLLCFRNVDKTVFEIINRYVCFVDKEKDKERSDWKTNRRWLTFIGENRSELRLTMKPEPYSYEKTLNWLNKQVAPTIKMALLIDEARGTNYVSNMIHDAKLKENHEKVIKQQTIPIEDIIL